MCFQALAMYYIRWGGWFTPFFCIVAEGKFWKGGWKRKIWQITDVLWHISGKDTFWSGRYENWFFRSDLCVVHMPAIKSLYVLGHLGTQLWRLLFYKIIVQKSLSVIFIFFGICFPLIRSYLLFWRKLYKSIIQNKTK